MMDRVTSVKLRGSGDHRSQMRVSRHIFIQGRPFNRNQPLHVRGRSHGRPIVTSSFVTFFVQRAISRLRDNRPFRLNEPAITFLHSLLVFVPKEL